MEEFLLYIQTIKTIIDRHYEKETVFYDNGKWYSRYHGCNITPQELANWVLELTETVDEFDTQCEDRQ